LRVELLNILGKTLLNLQDTSAAAEVLTQATREGMLRLGPDHPGTLRARVLMTPVYRYSGRTGELRSDLDQLLPVLRSAKGLEEELTIALKNKAHLEIDDGHYDAADRAAQEAVDVSLRALGGTHPETVAAQLIRAHAYQFSRAPDEALREAEGAYRTAMNVFADAPRHPRIIEGRLLYGRALGAAGDAMQGVEQLSQAVSDAAEVFGPASRMVGAFSLRLAEFQTETGRTAGALESSRNAVAIIARHVNPQSFRYAAAIHERGAALLAARRAEEALPDLTLAVETLGHTRSPGHPVTRAYQADRALALARAGRPRQALALLEPLLPDPGSPIDDSGNKALFVMGVATRLAGDRDEALRLLQRALDSTPGDRSADLRRMRTLTEIGLTLLDLGRPKQAVTSLDDALAISRRLQIDSAPDRADIVTALNRAK
jgi:tetratricopeptide (TPR) repeat protein